MEWLNYHHLLYFWTVANEGSIARACEKLLLAQPTISGQLRALERSLGDKLFARSGRGLVLTETGQTVYRYADEIFTLGKELADTLKGRPTGRPLRLRVGVADVLPKIVSYRLLEPALHLTEPVQIICREGKPDCLLAELSLHGLDIVLTDAPVGPSVKVRAFSHLLGECGVSIVATAELAKRLRKRFPQSLDGAPFLLPTDNTVLRRSLDQWFEAKGIRPVIRAECEDSALLKAFGQDGIGAFSVPSVVEKEVCRQYRVNPIGRLEEVKERFFAISVERKLKHPAVVAISDAARQKLFHR
jgi:LysR family transcriptional regulator, transcriptional activator of nhaA